MFLGILGGGFGDCRRVFRYFWRFLSFREGVYTCTLIDFPIVDFCSGANRSLLLPLLFFASFFFQGLTLWPPTRTGLCPAKSTSPEGGKT